MLERWEDLVHLEELDLSKDQIFEIRECINYNKIKKEDTDPHQRAKMAQYIMDVENEKTRDEEKSFLRFDRARDKIQTLKDKINNENEDTAILKPFVDDQTEDFDSLNLQRQ